MLPARLALGVDDDARHLDQLRVQLLRDLAGPAAIAEQDAVVAQEDDRGVLVQAELPKAVEELAQPAVGIGQRGRVDGVHLAQLVGLEVGLGARVARGARVGPAVGRVGVHVDELVRRAPGLVRIEAVDDQRERLLLGRLLHQLGRHPEDASRIGLRRIPGVARVGEVGAHPLHIAVVLAQALGEPALEQAVGHGRRVVAKAGVSLDRYVVVEAEPERAKRLREAQEGVVARRRSPVPGPFEPAGEDPAHVLDRRRSRDRGRGPGRAPSPERGTPGARS